MRKKIKIFIVLIAALAAIFFLYYYPESHAYNEPYKNFSELVYTRHAKCRMGCRNITESEIREILNNGTLNKSKSGYDQKHRDETYAVEGYSSERQHIRVVVTPKGEQLLVITVIDLDKDWTCDCT